MSGREGWTEECGEDSPLLPSGKDSRRQQAHEDSISRQRDVHCLRDKGGFTDSNTRGFDRRRSWRTTTLVAVLLVAIAGSVSLGLFLALTVDEPRLEDNNSGIRDPSTIPNTHVPLRHGTQFSRKDRHGFDIPPPDGDEEQGTRDNSRGAQPQELGHQDENGGGHDYTTGKAYPRPVSPSGLSSEGHGHNARDTAGASSESTKPNIFVFLIDDMGWNDIGYQSTDLSAYSPRLDGLAAEGIKLSNYYSMNSCTPARASLMTGRYTLRYGMQYYGIGAGAPWGMPLTEKIMAQYFNNAGYVSHMVGKWHLGMYMEKYMPNWRGFDTFLGYVQAEDDYWTHKSTEEGLPDNSHYRDFGWGNSSGYYDVTASKTGLNGRGEGDASARDQTPVGTPHGRQHHEATVVDEGAMDYDGVYAEDIYLGRALRIIESKTPWDEDPLFLYVAHQAVHGPISEVPEDAFTAEEEEMLQRLRSTTSKRVAFARTLLYLDKKIGQFVDALESRGWLENSIIVVASDNGGCPDEGSMNYPLRGYKLSSWEGGIKVPSFVYSKSHLPQEVWGSTYDGLAHVTDWLPTLASASGIDITGSAGPLDGVDHWEAFTGQRVEGTPVRENILHGFDSYAVSSNDVLTRNDSLAQGAFRQGKWKLITNEWCTDYSSDGLEDQEDPLLHSSGLCVEGNVCHSCLDDCTGDMDYKFNDWLFDIENDPRETTNLVDVHPEIALKLKQRAKEIAFKEFQPSHYESVDERSYSVWESHGSWMRPWLV